MLYLHSLELGLKEIKGRVRVSLGENRLGWLKIEIIISRYVKDIVINVCNEKISKYKPLPTHLHIDDIINKLIFLMHHPHR
jgi:hypothetical protein